MSGMGHHRIRIAPGRTPFVQGRYLQHIEIPSVWLERGLIDAQDPLLLDGVTGLAGQRCLASLLFASGSALARQRRDTGLALARQLIADHDLQCVAGATCPNPQVMVVRVLSDLVEPATDLLRQIWSAWRSHFWQLAASHRTLVNLNETRWVATEACEYPVR